MSVYDGTVNEHGAVVIYAGGATETGAHRTHRCVKCHGLFGTEDPAQTECGRPACSLVAAGQEAAQ